MTSRRGRGDPYLDLADDVMHEAAVASRREERDRRQHASELATWVGTLRDLAERRTPVSITTSAGRTRHGALIAVARDHLALREPGRVVLLASSAIRALRPEPGGPVPPAMGDRDHAQDRTFAEALERLAVDPGEVAIRLADVPDVLRGVVLGMGDDVLTLRLDGRDRRVVYVPIAAIEEVLWSP